MYTPVSAPLQIHHIGIVVTLQRLCLIQSGVGVETLPPCRYTETCEIGVWQVIDNRLSVLLGERRMNVRELSKATGLDYGGLLSMYHGKTKRYDAHVLVGLCRYFGIGIGDLLVYVPAEAETKR